MEPSVDTEMAYAHQTFESSATDVKWDVRAGSQPFPPGAKRAALLLGRDAEVLAMKTANGDTGFAIKDGRCPWGLDHCRGRYVVVF